MGIDMVPACLVPTGYVSLQTDSAQFLGCSSNANERINKEGCLWLKKRSLVGERTILSLNMSETCKIPLC